MTTTAQHLLDEAMKLEIDERSELIARLLDTVEPRTDSEYQSAWAAEIKARIQQVERGEVKLIPWREAMAQIRRGVIDDK